MMGASGLEREKFLSGVLIQTLKDNRGVLSLWPRFPVDCIQEAYNKTSTLNSMTRESVGNRVTSGIRMSTPLKHKVLD